MGFVFFVPFSMVGECLMEGEKSFIWKTTKEMELKSGIFLESVQHFSLFGGRASPL